MKSSTPFLPRLRAFVDRLTDRLTGLAVAPQPDVSTLAGPRPVSQEPAVLPMTAPATLVAVLWTIPTPAGSAVCDVAASPGSHPAFHHCDAGTARNGVLLDRFERLWADASATGRGLDLWIACRPVRESVAQYAGSFPGLVLREAPTREHARLRTLGERRWAELGTLVLERVSHPDATPLARRVVATDASASGTFGMGIACVSAETSASEHVHLPCDATVGEILAIDLALRSFPGEPLEVLTDSRAALRVIARPDFRHPNAPKAALGRITRAVKSGRLVVRWVRGHDGHPLNERADSLARVARSDSGRGIPARLTAA